MSVRDKEMIPYCKQYGFDGSSRVNGKQAGRQISHTTVRLLPYAFRYGAIISVPRTFARPSLTSLVRGTDTCLHI